MNPFNNRWVALFVALGLLLIVAELVGTGENGGALSRAASSYANEGETAEGWAEAPPSGEIADEPRVVIEEVPEEDLPQSYSADEVDIDEFSAGDEPEMSESFSEDF
jgi:hypothetical protein